MQSGRNVDKFAGQKVCRSENGLVFLPNYINAMLSLEVVQYVDLGSHGMFICEVRESRTMSDRDTMTYTYYQQNVKPKPKTEGKKGFVCKVCGYIYDPEVGDPDQGVAPGTAFEDLPDTWVCPECGMGKDEFEPVE